MAILQPQIPLSLYPHHFHLPLHSPTAAPFLCTPFKTPRKPLNLTCSSKGQDDYLIDAPVSAGDGFSFSGGKYSDGPSPSDEWFKQGKIVCFGVLNFFLYILCCCIFVSCRYYIHNVYCLARKKGKCCLIIEGSLLQVKAHPVSGSGDKAKDPIFGLKMGAASQASNDLFRWFCVESGNADNPTVILIHGFPSQAYSYRKVLPTLSKNYHAIAFDWLGFGFSDKPQPRYGFDYTMDEFVASLESLINEIATEKVSLVVQGYFSPIAVKYASNLQGKLNDLILLNPPLTATHANLPSALSIFSTFLLGEIFCQDPLRASDKTLTSSGPYKMKEDDAMVYRRPYLTSGSAGFALNVISKAMKKDLKAYVEETRKTLLDENWKVRTTVCWGQRDRWLSYDGVEDFLKNSKHKLIELPMAGHHVQEDCGEELGGIISGILGRRSRI
ncbi:uncharacterized protein LOC7469371 isoform X1 [Populus trichocarpa]|uniref:Alpha/beta-Hydrolases superfamily protein n=1 Tax=Populus tomentosa TaxID=118781 RepID=A0A385JIV3_POPTO|nr:uncharacterized protein LOC7469371 isoform X1 [Populus trichocarpa]AXY97878.1 Alpha/beta-Hydrolases superfamily protein [Populus tomentosa]